MDALVAWLRSRGLDGCASQALLTACLLAAVVHPHACRPAGARRRGPIPTAMHPTHGTRVDATGVKNSRSPPACVEMSNMCGIVGYVGEVPSQRPLDVVMKGLANLEYRGYDSAGVALGSADRPKPTVIRAVGKLSQLRAQIDSQRPDDAIEAIGHTRWATHEIGRASCRERV